MKIFITGVSGFIGSAVAERMLADGHEVAGYLRQTNRLQDKTVQALMGRVQMYYGSLTDAPNIRRTLADFQPEAILHFGALSPVAYSFEHPHEVLETNFIGTVSLAEAALAECRALKLFAFAGSMEEYGFQAKREALTEADELMPACPYAVGKVAAEKYLQYLHYAHKFPAIIFRQTNAYGRRHNNYFIVERILSQMLAGGVCNLGDPRPVRNFLHIDDLVELYVKALSADKSCHGEAFVTGPDNGLSIEGLASEIANKLAFKGKINWHTRPVRAGEIFYLCSRPDKAKQMLGWEPMVSLDEGLDRTIAIWRQNLGITSTTNHQQEFARQ